MEVMKGYKKTIMGEIPGDWQLCEFSEVMDGFSSGQTPYRAIKKYYTGKIPWITSGELNYNIITDTNEKITEEAMRNTGLKIIPQNTFLFAITGLEAEGTRGSCAITGIDAATNQSCMALYPKKNRLITSYLYQYYLKYGKELALKYCQGTKQQSFTSKIAKTLPIIVPPTVEEQTVIATALTETDTLINKLEKIIEKKRSIKKGATQRLLRPSSDWEKTKLGEIVAINMGQSPSSSYYNKEGVGLPLIQGNADIDNRIQLLRNWTSQITKTCEKGDLIMTVRAPVGLIGIAIEKSCIGRGVCAIKPISVVKDFLFHLMIYKEKDWKFLEQGSTFTSANSSQILGFELSIPKSIDQQSEIANVLTAMDREIAELEVKLRKCKEVKKGMMQQLLTGKIRLI